MARSRGRRSLGPPKSTTNGVSATAIEPLESRCLFSAGAGDGPELYAPAAFVAQSRLEAPAPHAEFANLRGEPTADFAAPARPQLRMSEPVFLVGEPVISPAYAPDRGLVVSPGLGTFGAGVEELLLDGAPAFAPTFEVVTIVRLDYGQNYFSDSGASSAKSTAARSVAISAPDMGSFAERTVTDFTSDLGSFALRPMMDFAPRIDPGDAARWAPVLGAPPRGLFVSPQIGEDGHRLAQAPLISGNGVQIHQDLQGKRPNEALANMVGSGELSRPVANFSPADGEVAELQSLNRRQPVAADEGLMAAVAFRSAASAIGQLAAAPLGPAAAGGSESAWGSLSPLLPQFSPDVAQLGQAFDAVLADLDELGGELFSSLTTRDRLFWGLGIGSIAYYVAANHLQRSAPLAPRAAERSRGAGVGLRRPRLSVQLLVD